MTPKENLIKVLHHEKTDQVPWVPFAGVHAGKLLGYDAQEVLQDEEKLFDSLMEVNKLYKPSGQPVIFDLQVEAECLGCELVWAKDAPPSVAKHPLEGTEELETPCYCTIPKKESGRIPMILRVMERMISHKLDEIMKVSDRIVVFRDGNLVNTMKTSETSIDEMIASMVGRKYAAGYTRANYKTDYHDDIIMEVKNLNVENKVYDFNMKLHRGEILGITGLVGAGRSEVLLAVFGADKKKSGTIFIEGKEVDIHHPSDAIRYGMGLIPEGRKLQSLFLKFDVKQNITIATLRKVLNRAGFLSLSKEEKTARDYSDRLRVKTAGLGQKIINLSGGNQQKAVIARWLMSDPKILFLDEPTQGIDIGAKNEIYTIIEDLAKQGVSVVVVSSEMQETIGLCDRVLVMYEGRLSGELMHSELSQEALMARMSGK